MVTVAGRRAIKSTLAGRGHSRTVAGSSQSSLAGVSRGCPVVFDDGISSALWTAASGVTRSYAAITCPDGISRTYALMTGTAANTTAFIDWVPGGTFGPPPWATGIEVDVFITDWTYANNSNNGCSMTFQIRDLTPTVVLEAVTATLHPGWNRLRIPKEAFAAATGAPVWGTTTSFSRLRLRFGAIAGTTHAIYMGPMRWLSGEQCGTRSKICIAFDDNEESVYDTAFPIMRARNIPGSNAVISDSVGISYAGAGRCTLAELQEMNAAGWDCTNHTQTHGALPFLASASQATCETEIQTCRDYLIDNNLGNGISEHILCSPYGEFGANYYAAAAASGVKMFRRAIMTSAAYKSPLSNVFLNINSVPCLVVTSSISAANILAMVDSAAAAGASLIVLFHRVKTSITDASLDYTTANFTTVMDGLVASSRAGKFDLVNMADLYLASRLVV